MGDKLQLKEAKSFIKSEERFGDRVFFIIERTPEFQDPEYLKEFLISFIESEKAENKHMRKFSDVVYHPDLYLSREEEIKVAEIIIEKINSIS